MTSTYVFAIKPIHGKYVGVGFYLPTSELSEREGDMCSTLKKEKQMTCNTTDDYVMCTIMVSPSFNIMPFSPLLPSTTNPLLATLSSPLQTLAPHNPTPTIHLLQTYITIIKNPLPAFAFAYHR